MSIINLKIIFVKKQKQTRERPTQRRGWGGGGTFIITEMALFTLATDYLNEMGYPFETVLMGLTDRRKTAKNLVDSRKN